MCYILEQIQMHLADTHSIMNEWHGNKHFSQWNVKGMACDYEWDANNTVRYMLKMNKLACVKQFLFSLQIWFYFFNIFFCFLLWYSSVCVSGIGIFSLLHRNEALKSVSFVGLPISKWVYVYINLYRCILSTFYYELK